MIFFFRFGFLGFLAFWLLGFLASWLFSFSAFGGFLALAFRILCFSLVYAAFGGFGFFESFAFPVPLQAFAPFH